jgi:transketolase
LAADLLQKVLISTTVVNVSTLKPLDESLILRETKKHMAVITAEDHNIIGGLSEAICQTLTNHQIAVPFQAVAVRDHFAETGSGPELYEKYGLSANHVVQAVKDVLTNKKG